MNAAPRRTTSSVDKQRIMVAYLVQNRDYVKVAVALGVSCSWNHMMDCRSVSSGMVTHAHHCCLNHSCLHLFLNRQRRHQQWSLQTFLINISTSAAPIPATTLFEDTPYHRRAHEASLSEQHRIAPYSPFLKIAFSVWKTAVKRSSEEVRDQINRQYLMRQATLALISEQNFPAVTPAPQLTPGGNYASLSPDFFERKTLPMIMLEYSCRLLICLDILLLPL